MKEKIEVGDIIELTFTSDCRYRPFEKQRCLVIATFDALTPVGEEGINLEIDLVYGPNRAWFRYKPVLDGGTLTILKKVIKD